jgi:hypothetical protein
MKIHEATEQAYKNGYDKGEWEMFSLITSAYFGKQYYFLEDNGTVYSRLSHKALATKQDAYNEFLDCFVGY